MKGLEKYTKIGITGTRNGLTFEQKNQFRRLSNNYKNIELHIGDCLGADIETTEIVYNNQFIHSFIVVHPPKDSKFRAFFDNYDYIHNELDYLTRNKMIVDETHLLFAFPNTYKEQLRSGTWSTIRYAKKKNKKVVIIFPDGSIED